MGSYNRWCVDALATPEQIIKIINSGRLLDKGADIAWDRFCWRKWSGSTKWDPIDLIRALSRKFPEIIFSVAYSGEYGSGKDFYLNAEDVVESAVIKRPAFPAMSTLKRAIKNKKKLQDLRTSQLEKERIANEIASNLKRIQNLEFELNALKSKTNTLNKPQCVEKSSRTIV
jgi:hypothetical protein